MEAEPLELEDGEVIDEDEPNDVFETYNVLQRPYVSSTLDNHTKLRYSDESETSVDSETDSDSDSTPVRTKKPKLKIRRKSSANSSWHTKNDKYKVWCTQVQEESLTEDLVSCGVTKTIYQERSVESYNFQLSYNLNNGDQDCCNNNSSEDERETEVEPEMERRISNKRTNTDRRNPKLKLSKRKNDMEVDGQKGSVRIIADLCTTIDSTDADVATDITTKLHEKKDLLIRRIVDIIGKQKAIDFFHKTKVIEERGGMLIMNGSRRRTAGGVYLWLVKNDKHIPQEKIREVFYDDKREDLKQRRKADATARRQKAQELIKRLENDSEKDLPALLTRAELSTRQIAEEARLRRGEGIGRMALDSERTVTNPPPSPVTDDPDHSEHSLASQRQIHDYTDDFLDIGVEIDSMEVL